MKILWKVLVVMSILTSNVEALEQIALPQASVEGGIPLNEALKKRHSTRSFSNKELDMQTLAQALWSAYGITHETDKRTIPTALNQHDLEIYVALKNGVYLYQAEKNILTPVSDQDIRPLFATQDYMANTPVVLIYTGSLEDYSAMHAGSAYQNVGLFAASEGLANVVRGYFDKDEVAKALHLKKDKRVIISQALGYEEE